VHCALFAWKFWEESKTSKNAEYFRKIVQQIKDTAVVAASQEEEVWPHEKPASQVQPISGHL